jgi:hypothetical protein
MPMTGIKLSGLIWIAKQNEWDPVFTTIFF